MVWDVLFEKVRKICAVFSGDAIFLVFLVCSANFDILCSSSLSNLPNNSFMIIEKTPTRLVRVNAKHPWCRSKR